MNDPSSADVLLKLLTQVYLVITNQTDGRLEQEITLQMGGILVSGFIMTKQDYILGNPVIDQIAEMAANLPNQPAAAEDEKEDEYAMPEFIHLRKAQFFYPGQQPITMAPNILWRGRIDRVDGFVLGLATVVKQEGN